MRAKHKNVMALLRRHLKGFESFGKVAFEALKSAGRSSEIVLLNEPQSWIDRHGRGALREEYGDGPYPEVDLDCRRGDF